MTALVMENLALLSAAPAGIQLLRELVWELAVLGQLTGNSTLSWRRVLLGDVGQWGSGGTPLKTHPEYYGGDIPWLVIGDLNDGLVTTAQQNITAIGLANSSAKIVPVGTILIAMYGSIGKLGIAGLECATNQAIAHCQPDTSLVSARYLFVLLRSMRNDFLAKGQGLAQQNISQKILKAVDISLPPLPEQHRIVAKVDELMALCDRLEARQQDAETAHARLVQALLDGLTQARDAEEFQAGWERVAGEFTTLFTTEDSIEALKQAVLQSACSGRIVDPAKLMVIESIVHDFAAKATTDDPFDLPSDWHWVKLGDLCKLVTSGSRGWKGFYADQGSTFIRSQGIKADRLEFDQRAFVALPPNTEGARTQVQQHDLLITITGANVGKAAVLTESIEDAYVSQHVALVRLRDPLHAPYIHRWLINSHGGRRLLLSSSYGAKPGLNLQMTLPLDTVSHSWTTRWLAGLGRPASLVRTASG